MFIIFFLGKGAIKKPACRPVFLEASFLMSMDGGKGSVEASK